MKNKIIYLFISFLILVIIGFNAIVFVDAQAPTSCGDGIVQSPNDAGANEKCDDGGESFYCNAQCGKKILGWGWARHGGWLSLSCANLYECLSPGFPYNVVIGANNKVFGWAWSSNLGWVCFGETCAGTPGQVPSGGWVANVVPNDSPEPPIKGWGKILALGDGGWLSLSCENDSPVCGFPYQVNQVNKNHGNCSVAQKTTCSKDADCPGGETCVFRQSITLNSLAWSASPGPNGVGYIWFNAPIVSIPPWLQTRFGDIYARRGITGVGQPPPTFNATYRILSGGGITNFSSEQGTSGLWYDGTFGPINFPTPETGFSNVLGKLDVNGLLCDGVCGNCTNQFGTEVEIISNQSQIDNPLDGKIYCTPGNLTISSPITFNNASGFGNAAGTIVVGGNLIINSDMFYGSGSPERFRNLASVAWLVRGDTQINPTVSELVGNYVVLGNGQPHCEGNSTSCTSDADCSPNRCVIGCDPNQDITGCGQIDTCFNSNQCKNRLTVSGLFLARKLYLEREFIDDDPEAITKGSEIIIYDGRLLANTPPGVSDFAKALPVWRPGTFSE